MDRIGYHIFINLFVGHINKNFVKYRQFILIFALVRKIILRAFKNILNVFVQQNKVKDYSLKIRKNKKQEHKNVTKPLKKK